MSKQHSAPQLRAADWGWSPTEQAYLKTLANREPRDDDTFYEMFYRNTSVPRHVAIRARRAVEDSVGIDLPALHPGDNLAGNFDGLDFAYLIRRIEREFHIKIPTSVWGDEIDGTFDTLVQAVTKRQPFPITDPSDNKPWQFNIASLLWLAVPVALLLAASRLAGKQPSAILGMATFLVTSILVVAVVLWLSHREGRDR